MKVEKTNNNKVKIILTKSELAKRKITLKDIKEGKSKAQDFFFDVLEESNIADDFLAESSQLLIEVSVTDNNIFSITITKADCLPDIDVFSKDVKREIAYTVSSNLYEFSSLKELYNFALKAFKENLYIGNNSLYLLDDKYYVFFSNSTIKKSDFVKTFSILSEYSTKYYSKKLLSFDEYAKLIVKNDALQCLQKI